MIRKVLCVILLLFSMQSFAQLEETRYCGAPKRTATGEIASSAAVVKAFREIHPCPSTGLTTGSCTGWSINHVIPLACGGCDSVSNMQWLPNDIKTGTNPHAVDRFERKINASNPPQPDTPACVNVIVK